MRRLILLGAPGVGKGTQGTRLAAALGIVAISTGDLFRQHVRARTALGMQVSALLAAGDLVPDAVSSEMVAERLASSDAANGFLLDGYPRTGGQVGDLDRIFDALGTRLDAVVLLQVDDDELERRLLSRAADDGRADDDPKVIPHRIGIYHRDTEPLVDEYERRGLLIRVDGTGSPDEVQERLRAVSSWSPGLTDPLTH